LQILYFVDDCPVLSILEDFLPQLDAFFLDQEEVLQKCVASCYQEPPVELPCSQSDNCNTNSIRADSVSQDSVNAKALRECLSRASSEDLALEGGPARADVDEKYVSALEMSCLLRQRLLDVGHNWRGVVQKALCDHGRYKGKINRASVIQNPAPDQFTIHNVCSYIKLKPVILATLISVTLSSAESLLFTVSLCARSST